MRRKAFGANLPAVEIRRLMRLVHRGLHRKVEGQHETAGERAGQYIPARGFDEDFIDNAIHNVHGRLPMPFGLTRPD